MLSSITVLFNVCKSILILVLFLMHQVVSYTISRHEIHNKGNKALFKLRKTIWDDAPKVTTVLHIFNHTIRPILLYGSEILGYFSPSKYINNKGKNKITELRTI
jgi:hypothetical protein